MDDAGPLLASKKVVAVATGEAHTLALTGDGCVYTWGRGMFGRLGTGSESDQLFPVRVNFDSSRRSKQDPPLKFVAVAAGAYHSLALADDGSIWCWGYNIYGQLGVSGENSAVPCLLKQFIELDSPDPLTDESEIKSKVSLKVCSVKAGGMMSLAIDNLGALWMWGNCPQPSSSDEGVFSLVSISTPTPVWDFHGHTVVKVACGNEHVVALVSAGETYKGEDLLCYSWGSNNHGQLGLGDRESRLHPEIIKTFNEDSPWTVYEVACGAFHTALLTHKKSPSDTLESVCWTFGLGENGQLGHGTTQNALFPELVKELPQPVYLISVDCGLFHTSVLSSAGDVWSWGMEKSLVALRSTSTGDHSSYDKDTKNLEGCIGNIVELRNEMGYWKSKVLPKIKKVFEKNGTKKSAAAAEACKSFDESKEQITKEFEEKKTELQPKVLEIYEASSVEVKALVKEPKEPGLKKHSVAVHKFIEELVKIGFPGSKPVSEASSKYGPALIPGPVFFVFEKVSTFIVTEERVEPTPEAATTATEKEREIVLVEEEKKEEVVEKIEEEEKKEEVVEKIEEERKEVVVEAEKAEPTPTPTPTEPEAKAEEAAEPPKP